MKRTSFSNPWSWVDDSPYTENQADWDTVNTFGDCVGMTAGSTKYIKHSCDSPTTASKLVCQNPDVYDYYIATAGAKYTANQAKEKCLEKGMILPTNLDHLDYLLSKLKNQLNIIAEHFRNLV